VYLEIQEIEINCFTGVIEGRRRGLGRRRGGRARTRARARTATRTGPSIQVSHRQSATLVQLYTRAQTARLVATVVTASE